MMAYHQVCKRETRDCLSLMTLSCPSSRTVLKASGSKYVPLVVRLRILLEWAARPGGNNLEMGMDERGVENIFLTGNRTDCSINRSEASLTVYIGR